MIMQFNNKVLIIGYGSVSKCTLPLLYKHLKIPYKNVTVMDFDDKKAALKFWTDKGVKYVRERITPANMSKELSKYAGAGGLIIDLGWNIGCLDILTWCRENKVLYINTSVEEWDPYANIHKKTPFQKSLYYKQMQIRDMTSRWSNYSTTAILDHGANPGLISHFTKRGLVDIAKKAIKDKYRFFSYGDAMLIV
jgi:homospermidine synthase